MVPFLMKFNTDIYRDNNDVAISAYMKDNGISIFHLENMVNYRWELVIYDDYTNENYDDILYFRIKNSSSKIDISIANFVLNKLYNITL
jgi:hypothetical protein